MAPFGFVPGMSSAVNVGASALADIPYAVATAVAIWAVSRLVELIPGVRATRPGRLITHGIVIAGLLGFAFVCCLHLSLIWHLQSVPTRGLLAYAGRDFAPSAYLNYVEASDLLFFLAAIPLYYLHRSLPVRPRVGLRTLLIVAVVAAVPVLLWSKIEMRGRYAVLAALNWGGTAQAVTSPLPPELAANPIAHLIEEVFFAPASPFMAEERPLSEAQRRTVAFIDPAFTRRPPAALPVRAPAKTRWNIVLVQLESLGERYRTERVDEAPRMPFLHELARKSLVLASHFSSGVNTDYAAFSIYTGLYPIVTPIHFITRHDLALPTLFTHLGGGYDSFWSPRATAGSGSRARCCSTAGSRPSGTRARCRPPHTRCSPRASRTSSRPPSSSSGGSGPRGSPSSPSTTPTPPISPISTTSGRPSRASPEPAGTATGETSLWWTRCSGRSWKR